MHELRQAARQWAARGAAAISCGAARRRRRRSRYAKRHVLDLSATEREFLAAVRAQAAGARAPKVARVRGDLPVVLGARDRGRRGRGRADRPPPSTRRRRSAHDDARRAQGGRAGDAQGPGAARRGQAGRGRSRRPPKIATKRAEEEQHQAAVAVEHADTAVKVSREELERANTSSSARSPSRRGEARAPRSTPSRRRPRPRRRTARRPSPRSCSTRRKRA